MKNPNIIFGSPALLDLIMKNVPDEQDLSSITTFISGGDFLTPSHSQRGKEFLVSREIENMRETYYLKEEGIVTINYAYEQDGVVVYPDLIKLKIALDNGEILGIETTGYLNSHYERNIPRVNISKEEAKQNLNKNLNIVSESLAIIPTEFQTEIFCWEFKGNINDTQFLVYINAETGKEEDILVIKDTPNGTLTM